MNESTIDAPKNKNGIIEDINPLDPYNKTIIVIAITKNANDQEPSTPRSTIRHETTAPGPMLPMQLKPLSAMSFWQATT